MFEKREPDFEYIYKVADGVGLPMRVYMPKTKKESYKAVLCIHGGGWKGAVKDNSPWDGSWMSNHAQYYSDKGYVGISISYRDLDLSDAMSTKDQIEDCRDALIFIKEKLEFVEFETLSAIGDSAGGHLALCLGFLPDENLRPYKISAFNPVTDLTEQKWAYTGKTEEDRKGISPLYMVDEFNENSRKPMILCMHGDNDSTVSIETSISFEKKLKEKGFKSDMVVVKGASHTFILWGYTAPEELVYECMKISDKFLFEE